MRLRGRRMMPLGVILKNAWDYKYQIIGIIIVTTLLTMIYTLKAQIAVKELSKSVIVTGKQIGRAHV